MIQGLLQFCFSSVALGRAIYNVSVMTSGTEEGTVYANCLYVGAVQTLWMLHTYSAIGISKCNVYSNLQAHVQSKSKKTPLIQKIVWNIKYDDKN